MIASNVFSKTVLGLSGLAAVLILASCGQVQTNSNSMMPAKDDVNAAIMMNNNANAAWLMNNNANIAAMLEENSRMENTTVVGVTMKDGKMMTVGKGNKTSIMVMDIMLGDLKVMTDGTVTMKDGSKVMLKDGEMMDATGKVTAQGMVK